MNAKRIVTGRVVVALLGVICLPAYASAGPITFRFDAEVDLVVGANTAGLDINVVEGDIVSGQLTVESVFSPPPENPLVQQDLIVSQPFPASLTIGGREFHTPATESVTFHARSEVFVHDYPRMVLLDKIEIESALLLHDTLVDSPFVATSFLEIDFWGPRTVLPTAGIPGNAEDWNSFSSSRHLLAVLYGEAPEPVVITARIGAFSVVPEPASLMGITTCVLAVYSTAVTRYVWPRCQSFPSAGDQESSSNCPTRRGRLPHAHS